jgi:dipeptide/tripeptide permease
MKLNKGNLEAARNVTTWQGTCYLTPLIGAILADSYWGKYQTIAVFSSVYFIVSTRCSNPYLLYLLCSIMLHSGIENYVAHSTW